MWLPRVCKWDYTTVGCIPPLWPLSEQCDVTISCVCVYIVLCPYSPWFMVLHCHEDLWHYQDLSWGEVIGNHIKAANILKPLTMCNQKSGICNCTYIAHTLHIHCTYSHCKDTRELIVRTIFECTQLHHNYNIEAVCAWRLFWIFVHKYNIPTQSLAERLVVRNLDYHRLMKDW